MEGLDRWHPDAISKPAHDLSTSLGAAPFLSSFYLAGGTGLALRFGHRRSVDLDFFTRGRRKPSSLS